jgi:hypothetical protein
MIKKKIGGAEGETFVKRCEAPIDTREHASRQRSLEGRAHREAFVRAIPDRFCCAAARGRNA